ncbi:MAG: hypothetical protein Q7R66_10710 [Undibacterium sp.]|uniref:hypothetical protein n=1 Tax=Undibacterium sp. TaxID=1914977 RepID=UPI00271FB1F7|nr:hypothetical protein [Undibacterium sp.]MDO8652651.1 hypothetical protein [Undibacterium sp.]
MKQLAWKIIGALILSLLSGVSMGYDLHITKAAEWSESARHPITEEQWKTVVLADGEFAMDTTATAEDPETHEVIQISNPLMASWVDPKTKENHYFYYSRGRVIVKNPTDSAIKKMKIVASKLGAKVQGDESEWY